MKCKGRCWIQCKGGAIPTTYNFSHIIYYRGVYKICNYYPIYSTFYILFNVLHILKNIIFRFWIVGQARQATVRCQLDQTWWIYLLTTVLQGLPKPMQVYPLHNYVFLKVVNLPLFFSYCEAPRDQLQFQFCSGKVNQRIRRKCMQTRTCKLQKGRNLEKPCSGQALLKTKDLNVALERLQPGE